MKGNCCLVRSSSLFNFNRPILHVHVFIVCYNKLMLWNLAQIQYKLLIQESGGLTILYVYITVMSHWRKKMGVYKFMQNSVMIIYIHIYMEQTGIGLSTSALVDLSGSGSGSAGQLVYFGLTQICGNIFIQVLIPTGQVPVKSQVFTNILSIFRSSQYLQVLRSVYIVDMVNLCSFLCTEHAWYCIVVS